jgi:hypothetical protein
MPQLKRLDVPLIGNVVHPTDFSERVHHGSPCPLLAIPVGGFMAKALQAEAT